jgi:hypothetical protein
MHEKTYGSPEVLNGRIPVLLRTHNKISLGMGELDGQTHERDEACVMALATKISLRP